MEGEGLGFTVVGLICPSWGVFVAVFWFKTPEVALRLLVGRVSSSRAEHLYLQQVRTIVDL